MLDSSAFINYFLLANIEIYDLTREVGGGYFSSSRYCNRRGREADMGNSLPHDVADLGILDFRLAVSALLAMGCGFPSPLGAPV